VASHPLEPLSADEFRRTTEILRREGHVTETFRFASIELMEPGKQEVLAWRAGDALPPALVRGGVEPRRQQDLRSDGRPDRRCRPLVQADRAPVGGGVELKVHRPHPMSTLRFVQQRNLDALFSRQ
jgi:Copper amine oxidase, N2 domain